ncbi:MAG TPA: hypothetical protein VGB41_06415 [Acidimicrobiia bacterium]
MLDGLGLDDVVRVEVIQLKTRGDGDSSVVTDFTLRLYSRHGHHTDWHDAYEHGHEHAVVTFLAWVDALNAKLADRT